MDFAKGFDSGKVESYAEHYDKMQALVENVCNEFDVLRLQDQITHHDSVSQHGSIKSSSTTTSSARVKAAAKRAVLEAETSFLKEQQLLQ